MCKAKHVLPKSAMVSLYYTLAYSYLMYCNDVWGCIQESKLQKVTIIQKKIIRMITNAHYLEHTNTMFDELGILKLADINKYFSSVFMYKYENKYLRKCFVTTFTKNQEVHHYKYYTHLRSSNLQFAFETKHDTVMYTSILKETVLYSIS